MHLDDMIAVTEWRAVVVKNTNILVGICPGATLEKVISNAKIDYAENCEIWKEDDFEIITQKKYKDEGDKIMKWATAMSG